MKTPAIRKLRQKLAAGQPVYGMWITLESPSIVEMAVALGLDWVVIDAEHGHLDWKEIVEHLRAAVRSDTVALVRVAECNVGLIKRAVQSLGRHFLHSAQLAFNHPRSGERLEFTALLPAELKAFLSEVG